MNSAKTVFKYLGIITVYVLVMAAIFKTANVLGMIGAAVLVTIVVDPIVSNIQKGMPRKSRSLAILITLLLLLIILGIFGYILFIPLGSEISKLVTVISDHLAKNQASDIAFLKSNFNFGDVQSLLVTNAQKILTTSVDLTVAVVGNVGALLLTLVTITTMVFFMLIDTQKILNYGSHLLPAKYKKVYLRLTGELYGITTRYFGGVLVTSIVAGLFALIPLFFVRAEYIISLAFIIAIMDMIPLIGATIGAIIVIFVLVLTGNPIGALVMAIYSIAYQQAEGNILIPFIQKNNVKLSPLAILIALLLGISLGGLVGALLAIPGAAFIKVVFIALQEEGLIYKAPEEEIIS
jgi:predicted PurR-regulated permease PerM